MKPLRYNWPKWCSCYLRFLTATCWTNSAKFLHTYSWNAIIIASNLQRKETSFCIASYRLCNGSYHTNLHAAKRLLSYVGVQVSIIDRCSQLLVVKCFRHSLTYSNVFFKSECAVDFSCADLITSKISSQAITFLYFPNKELESTCIYRRNKIMHGIASQLAICSPYKYCTYMQGIRIASQLQPANVDQKLPFFGSQLMMSLKPFLILMLYNPSTQTSLLSHIGEILLKPVHQVLYNYNYNTCKVLVGNCDQI